MTVDPPSGVPLHFVIRMEYEGEERYFIFETARVIDAARVLPAGEDVIMRYLAGEQTAMIGPVPVCDDEEYMHALSLIETGFSED